MNNTIINVGRQFGSGGGFVAKAIGQKLGIPVYDNELISKASSPPPAWASGRRVMSMTTCSSRSRAR